MEEGQTVGVDLSAPIAAKLKRLCLRRGERAAHPVAQGRQDWTGVAASGDGETDRVQ